MGALHRYVFSYGGINLTGPVGYYDSISPFPLLLTLTFPSIFGLGTGMSEIMSSPLRQMAYR